MKINKTIKTELNKIPEEIKKMYGLDMKISNNHIHMNIKNFYINIDYTKKFHVEVDNTCIDVNNGKIVVTLWKNIFSIHTTVF